MRDVVVAMHAWGDADLARRAIESVPDATPVHVIDGRFAGFMPDAPVLTPGLREVCDRLARTHYHAPDESRLPFGHDSDHPDHFRPAVHAKAVFTYHEVLPQDAWAVQIDTDEVIERFDADAIRALDPAYRYQPRFDLADGREWEHPFVAPRIGVPGNWTHWIDDCAVPRDVVGRDGPLYPHVRREYFLGREGWHRHTGAVRIRNDGAAVHDDAYLRERVEHLRRIGRDGRANELEAELSDG